MRFMCPDYQELDHQFIVLLFGVYCIVVGTSKTWAYNARRKPLSKERFVDERFLRAEGAAAVTRKSNCPRKFVLRMEEESKVSSYTMAFVLLPGKDRPEAFGDPTDKLRPVRLRLPSITGVTMHLQRHIKQLLVFASDH